MFKENKAKEIINILKQGGIGILPTDTIYGLVGRALLPETIERIYKIRKRQPDKPFIILISSVADLKLFKIKLNKKTKEILKKYWPGQVSIILPCENEKFEYLHRGANSLAFRLPAPAGFPDKKDLIKILKEIGPLVAPSANPEGLKPALTIKQAKKYFSNQVDFYVDAGKLDSAPSTLIKIENGKVEVLRQGAVNID